MVPPLKVVFNVYSEGFRGVSAGVHRYLSRECFSGASVYEVIKVEYTRAPVCVIVHERSCREGHLCLRERDIKIEAECMNVLLDGRLQLERNLFRVNVFLSDCLHIKDLNRARIRDDIVPGDIVHVGFPDGLLSHRGHVEPVDVAPPVDLVFLVRLVLHPKDEELGPIREDDAALGKPLVAGVDDALDEAAVEDGGPHPLAEDDVDGGDGEVDFLDLPADEGDLLLHAVGEDDLAGLVEDGGGVDGVDVLGAGLGGEEREDPEAAADVENDPVSDDGVDGFHEKVGACFVLQKPLVHGVVCV